MDFTCSFVAGRGPAVPLYDGSSSHFVEDCLSSSAVAKVTEDEEETNSKESAKARTPCLAKQLPWS